jgi:hypothetical protein
LPEQFTRSSRKIVDEVALQFAGGILEICKGSLWLALSKEDLEGSIAETV